MITFDICSVDPTSIFCEPNFSMIRVSPQMSLQVNASHRQLRLRIHGSESFAVEDLDLQRFSFGFASVQPTSSHNARLKDFNNDGIADIEIRFLIDHIGPARARRGHGGDFEALALDGVHCFYGAFLDGEPFFGCVRPSKAVESKKAVGFSRRK